MTRRLVFRRTAQRQLDKMHARTVELSGSTQVADAFIYRVFQRLKLLQTAPLQGTVRTPDQLRTTGFERHTTIAFRVTRSKLTIVSIAFNGEQYQKRH